MLKRRQPPDLRDPANVHLCSPITAGLIPAHFRVLRSRTGWSWSVGPAATTCLRESLVAGWGSQRLLKGQNNRSARILERNGWWRLSSSPNLQLCLIDLVFWFCSATREELRFEPITLKLQTPPPRKDLFPLYCPEILYRAFFFLFIL